MKKILLFMSVTAALLLSACRGPQGPMGPQGPQGPKGADGVKMVSYQITIERDDWTPAYSSGQPNPDFFYYDIEDQNVTVEAAAEGLVMVYVYTEDYVQAPLPMFDYGMKDVMGEEVPFESAFRFDVYKTNSTQENGIIRVYYMRSDFGLENSMDGGHTFRVVILYP